MKGQPAYFVAGHHQFVSPDGELTVAGDTRWCSTCMTRLPIDQFYTRTYYVKKTHSYRTSQTTACIECDMARARTRKRDRTQILRVNMSEQDKAYERQRKRESRERLSQNPDWLQRDQERRRQYMLKYAQDPTYKARQKELRLQRKLKRQEEDAELEAARAAEDRDPLGLKPGDPEGIRIINRAIKVAGGQSPLERNLGLANNGLARVRSGERSLTLELLDQLHLYLGEPMLDEFDMERRSVWRARAKAEKV